MNENLTLVVGLFIHSGRDAEFEEFELAAASIMKRYGGVIERRIAFTGHGDPSQPDEVHIVTFPDADAFDRYRRDPDLTSLAQFRAAAIRRTILWEGSESPLFGHTGARNDGAALTVRGRRRT